MAAKGRLGRPNQSSPRSRCATARSYARYWQEAFRLPAMDHPADRRRHRARRGAENLAAGERRRRGRGVILALPHSGNWDAAAIWFTSWLGAPFMTVAERLKPESLYRRFLEYRESLGMRVVPLTGGKRPAGTLLREWLDEGRLGLPARRS